MAEVSLAIFGLKRVGTSLGLALKRHNKRRGTSNTFKIIGYDTTPENTKAAKDMKAVDKTANRPDGVAREQDLIVIALPLGEVKGAYEVIAADARPGAVIVDMSSLAQHSLSVAKKYLPENVHVICATPILGPKYLFDGIDTTVRATEDLFDNGTMMLMPSVKCIKEAVSLASNLASIVGAEPGFVDIAEHDVLVAGVEAFPALLGALVFDMFSRNESWANTQQWTNPSFAVLTRHLFDMHPLDLRDLCMNSAPALLHHIDNLMATLRDARAVIANDDSATLGGVLEGAADNYETWINHRMTGQWDDFRSKQYDAVKKSSMMGGMFGFGFGRTGDDADDD